MINNLIMISQQRVKSRIIKKRKTKFVSLTLIQNLDTQWYKEALLEMNAVEALLALHVVSRMPSLTPTSSTSSS